MWNQIADHIEGRFMLALSRRRTVAVTVSALGQQRTCRAEIAMSALPLKADIRRRHRDVSFGPLTDSCTAAK
jgi:hypothetical protein